MPESESAQTLPNFCESQPVCSAESGNIGSGIQYDRYLDCVHCGLCTSACPTYLETGNENDSPRGRIYLMRAVTDGKLQLSDSVRKHLDLCLDCRSCESACPSGVQYGRLIEPFRIETQAADRSRGKDVTKGWFHRFILYGIFPYPKRLKWALLPARLMQILRLDRLAETIGLTKLLPKKLQRMLALLPKLQGGSKRLPEFLPAIGKRRARVALFTGCVAEALFNETHWATARVLQQNGCDVVIPRDQACCGAIHYHSGAGEPAIQLANTNVSAFSTDDIDAVVVNVAGCGSMLKDYGHMAEELSPDDKSLHQSLAGFAGKIKDISEFLVELGPIPPKSEVQMRATYHDACHLVHAQKIRTPPRQLLELIPGLELVPLTESDICCGAAGSYNLTEADMSDRLAQRKLGNILETESDAVVSGNAGCTLQLKATLKKSGSPVQVLHPVELLDMSYGGVESKS